MKSDRLKDDELSKIKEHFREHPLLISCQRAFKRYQAHMAPLLFAPEEVFCEAAIIIDHIHEQSQTNEVKTYITGLWNELRIKLSKWEKTATPQNLDMATSSILYIVAIAMSRDWNTFCNINVVQWLFQVILNEMNDDAREMERVLYDLLEEGDGIEEWINNEYDGHLSEEIEAALKDEQLFVHTVINPIKAKEVISKLHQYMEGKTKPKDVLMPIRAAMDAGAIRRPTDEEFYNEFGLDRVKGKSSINDYTNPDKKPYIGSDFDTMKAEFKRIIEE